MRCLRSLVSKCYIDVHVLYAVDACARMHAFDSGAVETKRLSSFKGNRSLPKYCTQKPWASTTTITRPNIKNSHSCNSSSTMTSLLTSLPLTCFAQPAAIYACASGRCVLQPFLAWPGWPTCPTTGLLDIGEPLTQPFRVLC